MKKGECCSLEGRHEGPVGVQGGRDTGNGAHLCWVSWPCTDSHCYLLPGSSCWDWGSAQDWTSGQPKGIGRRAALTSQCWGGELGFRWGRGGEKRAVPVPDDRPGWHRNQSPQHGECQPKALCRLPAQLSIHSPRSLCAMGKGMLVTELVQSVAWVGGGRLEI